MNDGSDAKGKGRADGIRAPNKVVAAAEAAKRDVELRAMFVVVPPGDEAKSISCPICKEPLKSEFMEDDEEWVWRNAVKKDEKVRSARQHLGRDVLTRRSKIYHATCHAEAAASKTTLATRLKTEARSRSRSRTPEVLRTPPRTSVPLNGDVKGSPFSPSKLVGTKRKVEDIDNSSARIKVEDSVAVEDPFTPPTKKLALAASS